MSLLKRKPLRLADYDYSSAGAYFVTVCTKDRKNLLASIVGDDAHIVPEYQLSEYGSICEKYIRNIENAYESIKVDKYVIMPNHLHMIILLCGTMRHRPLRSRNTVCDLIIILHGGGQGVFFL